MTPIPCDRATFLSNLQQSGLVKPREFERIVRRLPATERGRAVARCLVDWKVLTRFQAELLLAGRTHGFFLGQYKILDQLGQGGMGRVFKAMHQTMKRVVALKVLAPQLVATDKARRLFKREVRAAARLHHPNIVTAFDANEVAGRHYLVMEFVDGPNLEQLVRREGPLRSNLACDIVRQAALGLQYAHELGLVHRDIKPANLLLQKPGKATTAPLVKILDFGLARLQQATPPADPAEIPAIDRSVMGTPDFLSPEQARNLPTVDIRSDIYSLGCTFYYLLTARPPFAGGTSLEKLLRHANEEPVSLTLFRGDVPMAVQDIVTRMLAKKPDDRFQSPLELAQALAPFASSAGPALELASPGTGVAQTAMPMPASGEAGSGEAGSGQAPAPPISGELLGTIPPELELTPFSEDSLSVPWLDPVRENRRLRVAIYLSFGVVIGLLLIVIMLLVMQMR